MRGRVDTENTEQYDASPIRGNSKSMSQWVFSVAIFEGTKGPRWASTSYEWGYIPDK